MNSHIFRSFFFLIDSQHLQRSIRKLNEIILAECEGESGSNQVQGSANNGTSWTITPSGSVTLPTRPKKRRRADLSRITLNCSSSVTTAGNTYDHNRFKAFSSMNCSQLCPMPIDSQMDWEVQEGSSSGNTHQRSTAPIFQLPNFNSPRLLSPFRLPVRSPSPHLPNDNSNTVNSTVNFADEPERAVTVVDDPSPRLSRNNDNSEVQIVANIPAPMVGNGTNDNAIVPDVEPGRTSTPVPREEVPTTEEQIDANSSRDIVIVDTEPESNNLPVRNPIPTITPVVRAPQTVNDDGLNQTLISLLECPVCLEYVMPPIHQCKRGHIVCSSCKPQLTQCPTCRSRFADVRSLVLEKIAEQLLYPCKNYTAGCQGKYKLQDKTDHEDNCFYRTYKCIISQCNWKGFWQEILGHMNEVHSSIVIRGEIQVLQFNFSNPMNSSQNWIVSALDEIFRVNLVYSVQRSQIFGCVQYIGPRRSANNFMYTLEVSSRNHFYKRRFLYSRVTHSDLGRLSSFYHSGDSFSLRADSANLFAEGGKLTLNLEIAKCDNN